MAISDYSQAICADPNYKDAYLKRAEIYHLIGKTEKTIEDEAAAQKISDISRAKRVVL